MAPGPMSLYSINAVLILDQDGGRIYANYYNPPFAGSGVPNAPALTNPFPTKESQKAFEKSLLEKTVKQTGDIILMDNNQVVLYKAESDIMLYVVANADQNEVLLYNVLLCLRDALHILFKASIDRRTTTENYDLVVLAVDEIVDSGIVLETEASVVALRVSRAPAQDVDLRRIDPFTEQGVNNLAQLGKTKLTDWFRQGF